MKKQIKKLSLNKKTISNLTAAEMNKHFGGASTSESCVHSGCCGNHSYSDCGGTRNGNSCPGHKTCYTC